MKLTPGGGRKTTPGPAVSTPSESIGQNRREPKTNPGQTTKPPAEITEVSTYRKAQARRLDFALRASLFETKTRNRNNRANSPARSGLRSHQSEKQALATTLPASRYVYLERAIVKRQEHRRYRSTKKTELPHP
ncbi:hypothetical protein ES705_25749 [subsurface metagenome]